MKIEYRKEIDGLRAIAVLSVIFYHLKINFVNFNVFSGGFIGVDIFFVISGYLISKILIVELKDTNKISVLNFYLRRARRILPVLFFILIILFLIGYFYLLPPYFLELSNSTFSILFFFSNIFFLSNEFNYGNFASDLNPLLHTWTLSLEEQFYILFPFLLIFLNNFFKKRILSFIILIAIISFFLGLIINYISQLDSRFYQYDFYLLPFRAWEILLGSIAAIIEIENRSILKKKELSGILSNIGFLLIIFSIFFIKFETNYLNLRLILPCIGTFLVILSNNKSSISYKIFTNKFFCFIGLILYSLYLWHFPIISLIKLNDINSVSFFESNYFKIFYLISIFILSILSYFLIEKPFRNKNLIIDKTLIITLASSFLILILLSLSVKTSDGLKNRYQNYELLLKNYEINNNKLHKNWEKDLFKFYSYKSKKNLQETDKRKNILIIGNSFAVDIFNIFNENKKEYYKDYNFLFLRIGSDYLIKNRKNFEEFQKADIVILATKFDSRVKNLSKDESFKLIKKEIKGLDKIISKLGKKLIVFMARPEFSFNAVDLNFKKKAFEGKDFENNYTILDNFIHKKINNDEIITQEDFKEWEKKYFKYLMDDKINLNIKLKNFLKLENISFYNPFDYSCNFNEKKCLIVTKDFYKIYFDYGHYTLEGAKFFGKKIDKKIFN